jgi:hypothetical protein
MEFSLGRIVWPPENRWQTPQTRPCRLREKAPHLRQHRAGQTNTLDHQQARQNDLKLTVAERSRRVAVDNGKRPFGGLRRKPPCRRRTERAKGSSVRSTLEWRMEGSPCPE